MDTLEAVFAQDGTASYELIVVDNNSTDATSHVVDSFLARGHAVRYAVEPRQGVSYARNRGIALARAPIVAFLDDDVQPSRNWVGTIRTTLEAHPEVACIGGPVLPEWEWEPPSWLSREHWAPLALQDYGAQPFVIGKENRVCLLSANLAVRREVFQLVGLFDPALQRVKDGIGSMEDLELLMRFWRADLQVMYQPELGVKAHVPLNRMELSYHRRWHAGHGKFYALLRSDEVEQSRGHIFGVPAHLFRKAVSDSLQWCRYNMAGYRSRALRFEFQLCFFAGFVRKRAAEYMAQRNPDTVLGFLRSRDESPLNRTPLSTRKSRGE